MSKCGDSTTTHLSIHILINSLLNPDSNKNSFIIKLVYISLQDIAIGKYISAVENIHDLTIIPIRYITEEFEAH